MMVQILAVAAGGALGSVLRFLAGVWVTASWPRHGYLATLAVNLLGCLLIGLLAGYFLSRTELSPVLRAGLMVGVLGGFTTFSSFSLDALRLLESGQIGVALAYVLSSVLGGLAACWLGLSLMR